MQVGCYSLDLYCDNDGDGKDFSYQTPDKPSFLTDKHGHVWGEFPKNYTDELGSRCRRSARRAGWILKKDGTAICPKCSRKKKL
jgi:hypothetical protein